MKFDFRPPVEKAIQSVGSLAASKQINLKRIDAQIVGADPLTDLAVLKIDSQYVTPIVEDLLQYGEVKRPYLGVGLQNISDLSQYIQQGQLSLPEDLTEGVIITTVEPSSPAAEAGLQVKDVIISINGTKVSTVGELRKYLYTQTKIGDEIKMGLYRNGIWRV
ncbi:S1C family serine protease [Bacillus songklensis]|uniref:S1C family serine protease n=1 Tax=Bacillus songklensis TaxID=1069116 RepID=UPI00366CBA19